MASFAVSLEHAWDDIDLGELTSPARPPTAHRRTRSDPSEIMQSVRAERGHAAGAPSMMPQKWDQSLPSQELAPMGKRDLSPAKATGFSPAMKKHASVAPARNSLLAPCFDMADPSAAFLADLPGAGTAEADEDTSDQLLLMPPPPPITLGPLTMPTAEEFEAAPTGEKAPKNYSKKDVPMWTVEEDLLILQLVEQVWERTPLDP